MQGPEYLSQSISMVLKTRKGSLVMHRDFGSRLFELLAKPMDGHFQLSAFSHTVSSVEAWLPKVKVESTEARPTSSGDFEVDVSYASPSGTNTLEGFSLTR